MYIYRIHNIGFKFILKIKIAFITFCCNVVVVEFKQNTRVNFIGSVFPDNYLKIKNKKRHRKST